MSLLDIDPEDILGLSAQNVEKLVCRLCQEAFRKSGLSATHVLSGGHINRPDGGKDIYVPPVPVHRSTFLPPYFSENGTIFQVKRTDMTKPSTIQKEIKNHPSIQDSVRVGQRYILVCSANDWSPQEKDKQLEVMRTEFSKQKEADLLILDGSDLVHWLRDHPCLILWVWEKLGRPFIGWQSYDDWSAEWGQEKYIGSDQQGVLHKLNSESDLVSDEGNSCKNSMSIKEGISALRKQLSSEHYKPIRLVGISGSGKTRLVGALFDERVEGTPSSEALPKNQVYYTGMSCNPDPHPIEMARQIIERDPEAILIVDNCAPQMHKELVNVDPYKKIRILTIEYDVREDEPDETNVFMMEASDKNLIETLLHKRYPRISSINLETITKMSDGNLRLADMLAKSHVNSGLLDRKVDQTLFERIFWQRNDHNDKSLLEAAQSLSLVYSFNGTEESEELNILASLVDDRTRQQLYGHVEELRRRKIVQSRGDMRAVLPPMLANWLAKKAFDVGVKRIVTKLFESIRLTKSFARRIGYLHDFQSTQKIAIGWLSLEEGLIGKNLHCLNRDGMEILENIAPSCPDKVLDALEKMLQDPRRKEVFLSLQNQSWWGYASLLQKIGYDARYFTRMANIIVEIARSSTFDNNKNKEIISRFLEPLCYVGNYAGNQASMEDKENLIKNLARQLDEKSQKLATNLLHAALKTSNLHVWNVSFGLHSRILLLPTRSQYEDWYSHFIGLCTEYSCDEKQLLSEQARKILEREFRSLWSVGKKSEKILGALEIAAKKIHEHKPWNEGWVAIRTTNYFDGQKLENSLSCRLEALERSLYPSNLTEEIRCFVLSSGRYFRYLMPGSKRNPNSRNTNEDLYYHVESLGARLAQEPEILEELLPELMTISPERTTQKQFLGAGLSKNNKNREKISQVLLEELKKTPPADCAGKDPYFLFGFLRGCLGIDQNLYNKILDAVSVNDALMEWLPTLQLVSSRIDRRGIDRLLNHLNKKLDASTLWSYSSFHRVMPETPDDVCLVIGKILDQGSNGLLVATDILALKFHSQENEPSNCLLALGTRILSEFFSSSNEISNGYDGGEQGYNLSVIFNTVLKFSDEKTKEIVCKKLCEDISNEITIDRIRNRDDYSDILQRISREYPHMFLDMLLLKDSGEDSEINIRNSVSLGIVDYSNVSRETFINWCRKDPDRRVKLMVMVSDNDLFRESDNHYEPSKFFFDVLNEFRDQESILIQESLPRMGRGSHHGPPSNLFQKRHDSIANLLNTNVIQSPEAREWAKEECVFLEKKIREMKEMEKQRSNDPQTSFE